jgi:hypothetical protein
MRKKGGKEFTPPLTHNFACSLLSSPPKQQLIPNLPSGHPSVEKGPEAISHVSWE